MRRIAQIAAVVMLVSVACSSGSSDDGRPTIVTTTTVLGDVAANVAGGDADVEVLMPAGASPHEFVASARQVASIYEADLVVANGLGLEEGLVDVLAAARADGVNVLEIGPLVDPITAEDGASLDPHVWLDPIRMQAAAEFIAAALDEIDARGAWSERADAYSGELESAHHEIESILAAVPDQDRTLVTNHDSLGYFADRYGFTIVGTVVPGGSGLGDPSSAELAELVAVIEREGVPAIFADTSEPDALAEAVAAEASTDVAVVQLYTGSLGEPGSGADTLIEMLRLDAERIAAALGR
jgi:zinc/manganese transport system substrate-binding protein